MSGYIGQSGQQGQTNRQRLMAERLLASAMDGRPVYSPMATLAKALTGGIAGWMSNRADAQDREREEGARLRAAEFGARLFGGGMPAVPASTGNGGAPSLPVEQPPPSPVQSEPLPPVAGAPRAGVAQPIADGIAARAALRPDSPTYAQDIMRINDGVVAQTFPGMQMPRPAPVVPPAAPGAAAPQRPATPQVNMAALAEGLASPDPVIRQQAQAAVQVLQLQRQGEARQPPTVQLNGPQGPGVYERTPQGLRFLGGIPEASLLPPDVEAQRVRLAQAGRPSVEVRSGQTFGEALGRNTAEQLNNLRTQATTAVSTVESAQRVRQLLDDGAITGPFANSRLGFERLLAEAGLIDGRRVANTQQLLSELAKNVLAASSQMTGVLTDRDIQFLREASGGNIELDAATIRRIVDLTEQGSRRVLAQYNSTIQPLLDSPDVPEIARRIYAPIQLPAAPAARPAAPGAPGGTGRTLRYNPTTGQLE